MWEMLSSDYSNDFDNLKNESIASIDLMNVLWKDEDNRSNEDFTIRKYLLSLMVMMTLAAPWNFKVEADTNINSSNTDIISIKPLTHYLIPSNLRLFEDESTKKKMEVIDEKIPFSGINDSLHKRQLNCIVVDFSKSFLPLGFFDQLLCLLVESSSSNAIKNDPPIVANGVALIYFNTNHFRIQEDLHENKIIIVLEEDCDKPFMVTMIGSLVKQLWNEMQGKLNNPMYMQVDKAQYTYSLYVVIWDDENEPILVDIDEVRKAIAEIKIKIIINGKDATDPDARLLKIVKVEKVKDLWMPSSSPNIKLEQGEFIGFISHMKAETVAHAVILYENGNKCFRTKLGSIDDHRLFLDSDNLSDLRKLMDYVKKSKVIIVLLSKSYLTRPWCLAKLYVAIKESIPVVSVHVAGTGYDFDEAKGFLETLTDETLDNANSGASKILKELGLNVQDVGKVIFNVLPNIIAKEFNTGSAEKVRNAQIDVIFDKVIEEATKPKVVKT